MADQLPYIQDLLNANPEHDFEGEEYEIAGTLTLPDGAGRLNLRLRQLTPGATSVTKTGGWLRGFQDVFVDRGTDKTAGTITTPVIRLEKVFIAGLVDNIEVTGHGKGTGVYFVECHNFALGRNFHVHDMTFSQPALVVGMTEQIFGVWFNQCSGFTVQGWSIHHLTGEIGAVTRHWYTDAICVSGCFNFSIIGNSFHHAGELIDLTGSVGNRDFWIIGNDLADADAFCMKIANSASHGVVRGNKMARAGWMNFVISGPSEAGLSRCEDILVIGNESTNPGDNDYWAGQTIVGMGIMQSSCDTAYPKNISFLSNLSQETRSGSARRMHYGFRNDNGTSNRMANCTSSGHLTGSVLGTFSYG